MTLTLTPTGRSRFTEWLQDVGKPGLDRDAVESAMLDACLDRAEAEESMIYELRGQFTTTGRPEIFFADAGDFEAVLWELYETHSGSPYGVGTTKDLAIANAMADAYIHADSDDGIERQVAPSREWIMEGLASGELEWRLVDKPST